MTGPGPRLAAVRALYAAEATDAAEVDVSGLGSRARKMARGAWEHRETIDQALAVAATGWRLERMPSVDRNVLRVALWELNFTSTPVAVVIDEAVELAKTHSTDRSGAFVNGVLGRLVDEMDAAAASPGESPD